MACVADLPGMWKVSGTVGVLKAQLTRFPQLENLSNGVSYRAVHVKMHNTASG